MKLALASDEELRENGYDPAWIAEDEDREGPYAAIRIDTICGCCGGKTLGWTVINLMTATGIGCEWTHDDAQIDAEEDANARNAAWLEGFRCASQASAT